MGWERSSLSIFGFRAAIFYFRVLRTQDRSTTVCSVIPNRRFQSFGKKRGEIGTKQDQCVPRGDPSMFAHTWYQVPVFFFPPTSFLEYSVAPRPCQDSESRFFIFEYFDQKTVPGYSQIEGFNALIIML